MALRHLVLRTPRLELRPDDDAGLLELVEQVYAGIHDPDEMPFSVPWTDAPREELGRNSLQFHWAKRAALTSDDWEICFIARLDGRAIGGQAVHAVRFAVTREVGTGSWLGRAFQGKGLGTEMRAAVLQLVFDHLDARTARSEAWLDNAPSRGVSRGLGYVPDGTETQIRRGRRDTQVRLLLTAERFAEHRPVWTVTVDGLTDECRKLLGA